MDASGTTDMRCNTRISNYFECSNYSHYLAKYKQQLHILHNISLKQKMCHL